jgi:hypothetical protein
MTFDEIQAAAMSLPVLERERLGMLLLESSRPPGIMSEDDPGFLEELERRSAALDRDPSLGVPFEEVSLRLRQKLKDGRNSRS